MLIRPFVRHRIMAITRLHHIDLHSHQHGTIVLSQPFECLFDINQFS